MRPPNGGRIFESVIFSGILPTNQALNANPKPGTFHGKSE